MEVIIGCLLIITAIAIYFPIAHIRWGNKVLKALEEAESNNPKG